MTPFRFNTLLTDAGVPIEDTILLRHQKVISGRPTPYVLWRDARPEFDRFQTYQSPADRSYFSRSHWASFVVTPEGDTLFVGLYRARLAGKVAPNLLDPVTGLPPGMDKHNGEITETYDLYECEFDSRLSEFDGRLFVDWGPGLRRWGQVAANQDKYITEFHKKIIEPDFPGYLKFIASLSEITSIPPTWKAALTAVGGVYLLTCPKTKEQYVGKASGSQGFLGRWLEYFQTGHGGNLGLKSRDPSDYQVSILEVSGSSFSEKEIIAAESLWKEKLQSRKMGLNNN